VALAVAQHRGGLASIALHRLQRLLGLAFLDEADQRVDQHHTEQSRLHRPVLQQQRDQQPATSST
jgi:hypothetical protein